MIKKVKEKITLENLLCIFIIICPILDIISFLFRNYFTTTISPTTIIRPIIPATIFIILFFKEKNKKQKIIAIIFYTIYAIIHLLVFQKLHNESSYGNWKNELQYIINYSFMIINIYNFFTVIKSKEKIKKSVYIALVIYIFSLIISIITKTASTTYIEGIGYKGYFESGNSLCTVLLLSICILIGNLKLKEWKKIIIISLTGIYLVAFAGMRTGLYGFSLIIGTFIISKIWTKIKQQKKINKKQIIIIIPAIVLILVAIFLAGSKTLERRKQLKQNEKNNIDEQTQEKRYVTGDILNIYKQIQTNTIQQNYMSKQEQKAIIKLYEFAQKIKLSNVNLRAQQLIYNTFLLKEQQNIILILFGNGYKNQTGELVMEMEVPALLYNFGLIGFIIYLGPILSLYLYEIYKTYKNRKNITTERIMYLSGSTLAILLSALSGYVFFNISSMTMAIILVLLNREEKQ